MLYMVKNTPSVCRYMFYPKSSFDGNIVTLI